MKIALPAPQNAEWQRHVGTAIRHWQRHHIRIDTARHARSGTAEIDGKIAPRTQRRRGEVELFHHEPVWRTRQMRHQRQRTVTQPGRKGAQTFLLREAESRDQPARAGMA